MVGRIESIQLTCSINNFLHPGIAKFNDPATVHVNKMIMLHTLIGLFKLCNVFSKLVLDNKVAIQQQFNGIVQSSPTYSVILVFHV